MLAAAPATEVLHPAADFEVPVVLAAVPAMVHFRVNKKTKFELIESRLFVYSYLTFAKKYFFFPRRITTYLPSKAAVGSSS